MLPWGLWWGNTVLSAIMGDGLGRVEVKVEEWCLKQSGPLCSSCQPEDPHTQCFWRVCKYQAQNLRWNRVLNPVTCPDSGPGNQSYRLLCVRPWARTSCSWSRSPSHEAERSLCKVHRVASPAGGAPSAGRSIGWAPHEVPLLVSLVRMVRAMCVGYGLLSFLKMKVWPCLIGY